MKLTFLDNLAKRVAFSFGLSAAILIGAYLFFGSQIITLFSIAIVAVVVYVPVTLFYAIVSTFFVTEKPESDILDEE